MPKGRKKQVETPQVDFIPELNPEAREAQMINLAIMQAERQLREGTAPAQVVTHYLKLATAREKKELEILEKQAELIKAKTEMLAAQKETERMYKEAIDAMRLYSGFSQEEDDEDIF